MENLSRILSCCLVSGLLFAVGCGEINTIDTGTGSSTSPNPGAASSFASGSLLADSRASWLGGTWQGQGVGSQDFKITINPQDNSFAYEASFQVGTQGDPGVSSTACHYRETGEIRVDEATQDTKTYFQKNGKDAPDLELTSQVTKYELIVDSSSNKACEAFIEQLNQEAPTDYSMAVKKSDNGSFVDAWTGVSYTKSSSQ